MRVWQPLQIRYLGRDELQATTLPVLLLLQQVPHLRVVLGQAVLPRPRTFLVDRAGGRMLPTHTQDQWGALAQWLGRKTEREGYSERGEREREM